MAIDFTIPDDAKDVRERVRKWVHDECLPAEKDMAAGKAFKTVLKELRAILLLKPVDIVAVRARL